MSDRIKRYGAITTPLDRNGISAAANVTAGTAITLGGALTSVKPGTETREFVGVNGRTVAVGLYSGADMTAGAGLVTVVGFADFGRNEALTETILLPNAAYVLGTSHFAVITSITPDTSIAQDLEVGTDADATNATSSDIYVPVNRRSYNSSVQVTATGTITASVAVSKDPILDGTVKIQDAVFVDISGLDAVSGTEHGTIPAGTTLVRARYSAATATEGLVLTVVESSK